MQILVLIIAPIGDTLFATPALKALRNGYPQADIGVIATTGNIQILLGNKNIDRLITVSNKKEMITKIISLRDKTYDLVIGLSNIGSYASYMVNGRKKTGFKGKELNWIYNYNPPDDRTIHAVDYNLEIVGDVGGIPEKNPVMEIPLTISDYKIIEDLTLDNSTPYIAIHPGGKFFAFKRWPVNKYKFLVKEIDKNMNVSIILLGGREEKQLVNKLIDLDYSYNHFPLNLAGILSLKETAALLDNAVLFIGNDSAPQHIAAAMNTPVISIFGPTNPGNFHPYGTEYKIIRKERSCSPCFYWLGDLKQYLPECIPYWLAEFSVPCLKDIKVADVMAELESMQLKSKILIS